MDESSHTAHQGSCALFYRCLVLLIFVFVRLMHVMERKVFERWILMGVRLPGRDESPYFTLEHISRLTDFLRLQFTVFFDILLSCCLKLTSPHHHRQCVCITAILLHDVKIDSHLTPIVQPGSWKTHKTRLKAYKLTCIENLQHSSGLNSERRGGREELCEWLSIMRHECQRSMITYSFQWVCAGLGHSLIHSDKLCDHHQLESPII